MTKIAVMAEPQTRRNLNKTWNNMVWHQYKADFEADVPFPIRYLIHAGERLQDIFITIPSKIPCETLRRALLDFLIATRRPNKLDPIWENEHISIRPRIRPPIPDDVKHGSGQTTGRNPTPTSGEAVKAEERKRGIIATDSDMEGDGGDEAYTRKYLAKIQARAAGFENTWADDLSILQGASSDT